MTDELMKETKPNTIKLGDVDYELSPLNLNVLVGIEEEFGVGIEQLGKMLTKKQATSLRNLLYILLKDKYPDLTKAQIGEMVRLDNFEEVSNAITVALTR